MLDQTGRSRIFARGRAHTTSRSVTVIVTLYNYADYVIETLDSVIAQTHAELNLIIVNDRSTDKSEAIVKLWMGKNFKRFGQTLLLRNTENYGLATSRNAAFDECPTELVFVLDADNLLYPTAIERLVTARERSGAEGAYCQLEMFGEVSDVGLAYFWDRDRFKEGNYVDAMALVKKSAWRAVGGYSMFEVAGWEDYDLWCKFIEHGFEAVFLPQILCRYRVHKNSMLQQETNVRPDSVVGEMLVRHPWLRLDEFNAG